MELMKVVDLLVDKIKREYKDDIAIVALCGSYIYGDTHEKSDLDFYFIPKTERGYEMAQCFILEGIGFDFWGMSWSRAESLAGYDETNTSIISKARIIYYSTQEDLDRFNALRDLGSRISKEEFLKKAAEQVDACQEFYFRMLESKDSFSSVKRNAIQVLYYAAFSIALLNGRYIERGGRNLLKEILMMALLPDDFENSYMTIVNSRSIEEMAVTAQTVIISLRNLIQLQREPLKESITQGFYEEIKSIYNKLLHECETDNRQGIMLAIARLDHDVFQLLNNAGCSYSQFPDLFSISCCGDNGALIKAVHDHEKLLLEILNSSGVQIVEYKALEDFRAHLEAL
jgi:hypothetical protein